MKADKKFSITNDFDNSITYLWLPSIKCAKDEVRIMARNEGKEIKNYTLKQL